MNGTRLSTALIVLVALASVALAGCGNAPAQTRAAESLAPDLGKIAYVLDGVIYVKDLPDGDAMRLAEGSEPRWSPSGDWLLFFFDDSDWLVRADGADRHPLPRWLYPEDPRIAPSVSAAWSPAGDTVAYASAGALFIENADGTGKREVTTVEACPSGLEWSPDGTRLAYDQEQQIPLPGYLSDGEGGKTFPMNRRASLWAVDVETGANPIELYATTSDGILAAGWLGNDVLFWRDISFAASAMADGLPLEAISAQPGAQPRELAWGPLGGWSPSPAGDRIAMTVPPGRESWTSKRIVVVDVGGEVRHLTSNDQASIQPVWSPDGRRIAFVSKPDVGDGLGGSGNELENMASDRRIWVMNSDGGDHHPLTDDPAYRDEHPLWSASGSQILFARLDSNRHASLWLVPAAGGEARRVLDAIGPSGGGLTGYYTNIGWDFMLDWWQGPPS